MTYVLCHLSNNEINDLNSLQKKPVYDKETGLRKFPVLKNILSPFSSLDYFNVHLWRSLESNNVPNWIKTLSPLPSVSSYAPEEEKDHPAYEISKQGIVDKNLGLCPEQSIKYLMAL